MAGAKSGRGDARQRHPGGGGPDVLAADQCAASASRSLRLSCARVRRHRLGTAGVGRRQPGEPGPAGGVFFRRWQRDVFDPGAVDRGASQAAADGRDRQQWRLSHYQAAAIGVSRRRSLRRHGFRRSTGGFYWFGKIPWAGGDADYGGQGRSARAGVGIQPARREIDRGGGGRFAVTPSLRAWLCRVGKGALAPCPPSIHIVVEWWARFALPTLQPDFARRGWVSIRSLLYAV